MIIKIDNLVRIEIRTLQRLLLANLRCKDGIDLECSIFGPIISLDSYVLVRWFVFARFFLQQVLF